MLKKNILITCAIWFFGVFAVSDWASGVDKKNNLIQDLPPQMTVGVSACLGLSVRYGRETCWVKFPLKKEKYSLCVPKYLWLKWLQKPRHSCGVWIGKYRAFSPPSNNKNGKNTKELFLRFVVSAMPESANNSDKISLFEYSKYFIEKKRERVSGFLAVSDSLGIMRKLILNEKTPEGQYDFLRLMGFVHLFSASGLHLYAARTILNSFVWRILFFLGVPIKILNPFVKCLTLLFWFWAWALNGFRAGMLRPWIIVWLRFFAEILGFKWRAWSPLFLAICVDLTVAISRDLLGFPGAWAMGRWHYALAVGGGLFAIRLFNNDDTNGSRRHFGIREHIALSVGSWLFTAILDAFTLGFVAVATPVLSLLTIPFFSICLYPQVLALALVENILDVKSIKYCFDLLGFITNKIVLYLHEFSIITGSLWAILPGLLPVSAVLSGCIVFGGFYNGEFKKKLKICLYIVTVLGLVRGVFWGMNYVNGEKDESISALSNKAEAIEQLDVGQGDAAIVYMQNNEVGLIDTGGEESLSEVSWVRLLNERGIYKIDWVALTHLDEDHAGGLLRLIKLLPISRIILSKSALKLQENGVLEKQIAIHRIKICDWDEGCFPYYFLSSKNLPKLMGHKRKIKRGLIMNVVLIPFYGGGFYLNAGDADFEKEIQVGFWVRKLLKRVNDFGLSGAPRIIKVSHHGSRFSTNNTFLRLINPTTAWVSSGIGNMYNHPSCEVLERLKKHGIKVSRTDKSGGLYYGQTMSRN